VSGKKKETKKGVSGGERVSGTLWSGELRSLSDNITERPWRGGAGMESLGGRGVPGGAERGLGGEEELKDWNLGSDEQLPAAAGNTRKRENKGPTSHLTPKTVK